MIARTAGVGALLATLTLGSVQAANTVEASDRRALQLMTEYRAASGGAALDRHQAFHETGTIIRDGHAGTYEMYGDLRSLRNAGVHTLDGKFGGGGFDGTAAWRIGSDGKTVVDKDPAAVLDARASAYFTIGGYNWPDRFPATFRYLGVETYGKDPYDVVSVTPEGASSNELWLDRRTHRLARITADIGGQPASADILDNRLVDGTLIGFKSRQVEAGHVMIQTLATFDYVPLDPHRLEPPTGK